MSSLLGGPEKDETAIAAGSPPGVAGDRSGARAEIEIQRIRPNPHQPRQVFDAVGLEELRDSIQSHGLLQPVVLRRRGDDFELIAGERRWRAARMAGLERVAAVVLEEVSDSAMLELALVENVQRRDLDALEKAEGFRAMMQQLALTQEQVADKVGLKRSTVTNHLRLLDLPPQAQEALRRGLISMGHARVLAGLPREEDQLRLLGRIAREELSVRQVEELARNAARGEGRESSERREGGTEHSEEVEPWARELQDRLRAALGAKVRIQNRPGYRGQIQIDYYGRGDLDRLVQMLLKDDGI